MLPLPCLSPVKIYFLDSIRIRKGIGSTVACKQKMTVPSAGWTSVNPARYIAMQTLDIPRWKQTSAFAEITLVNTFVACDVGVFQ